MNLIINPTGISIILNHIRNNEALTCELRKIKNENVSGKEISTFMGKVQNEIDNKNLDIYKVSAETNSLFQMKEEGLINPREDKLVLFYSDTIEGKIAADLLKTYFSNNSKLIFQIENIELNKLENITPNNSRLFGEGIKALWEEIKEYQEQDYDYVFYNFTAGYKGLIPAMTMLNIKKINHILCYKFEASKAIIAYKFDEDGNPTMLIREKNETTLVTFDRLDNMI